MADGKIQVIMDKDDLQPLADSIKILGDISSSEELSLAQMESIVNEKATKLKTCSIKLIINEAGVGAGWYSLVNGEPEYCSICLPFALTEDIYQQLQGNLAFNSVMVGSTLWVGSGVYVNTNHPVTLSGACRFAPGHENGIPANRFGSHIIIEGDCTITYG